MPSALVEAAAPPMLAREVAVAWPVADSATCVVTAADMLICCCCFSAESRLSSILELCEKKVVRRQPSVSKCKDDRVVHKDKGTGQDGECGRCCGRTDEEVRDERGEL